MNDLRGPREGADPAPRTGEGIPYNGHQFAVVEDVRPRVDDGRFPVKRVVGESVQVEAACFAHGHELAACAVRHRGPDGTWREAAMEPLGNDRWRGAFVVDEVGRWEYEVLAWVDHLTHWRGEFIRRVEPDDIVLAARMGAELIARCQLPEEECRDLAALATILRTESDVERLRAAVADDELFRLARAHEPRDGIARSAIYAVQVDRVRARFSTWYEIFPRSCSPEP
ncbi:MAG TPA: maltotransferase domain-containing protein, partial [Gemmatimonadales bacterium]|nr:maltotransferase domain-containing protein [Gemmatimonadales bacterium]